MGKYLLAVFDLDGTLLDTLDDLTDSVNFALSRYGMKSRTKDEIRSFVGNGIRRLIDLSLPENTEKEIADSVFECFKEHYAKNNANLTAPYEGVVPLLCKLKDESIKLALVSNKADFAVKNLAKTYFDGLFDIAVGEKEGIPRKPHPASLNEVLYSLSIKKEAAIYIGDSDVDILTAKNADVDCVSVTWGFRDRDFLIKNGAERLADTVQELEDFILKEKTP